MRRKKVELFSCEDLHDDLKLHPSEGWSLDLIKSTVHHLAMYLDTHTNEAFELSIQGAKLRNKTLGVPVISSTCMLRYITGYDLCSVMCAARLANLDDWSVYKRGVREDRNSIENISIMVQRIHAFARGRAVWFSNGFMLNGVFYFLDITRQQLTEDKVLLLLGADYHAAHKIGVFNPRINRVCTAEVVVLS